MCSKILADTLFAWNDTVTLTFDLVTTKCIGVIYWPWPLFLLSTCKMTVIHKIFKILSGHGFCIKCYCDLAFDMVTSKFIGVICWPWPIFISSTMTVAHKLFKILSGHIFYIKCYCGNPIIHKILETLQLSFLGCVGFVISYLFSSFKAIRCNSWKRGIRKNSSYPAYLIFFQVVTRNTFLKGFF